MWAIMIFKSKECVKISIVNSLQGKFVFNASKIIKKMIKTLITLILRVNKKFNKFLMNLNTTMLIEWIT